MQAENNALSRRNDRSARLAQARPEPHVVAAPVDIFENADEVLIVADFPGVAASALQVRLDGSELVLEGRRDGGSASTLRRSFQVPRTIDPERVSAEIDNGILRVRLGKREDAKPRRIEVKAR